MWIQEFVSGIITDNETIWHLQSTQTNTIHNVSWCLEKVRSIAENYYDSVWCHHPIYMGKKSMRLVVLLLHSSGTPNGKQEKASGRGYSSGLIDVGLRLSAHSDTANRDTVETATITYPLPSPMPALLTVLRCNKAECRLTVSSIFSSHNPLFKIRKFIGSAATLKQ